MTRIFLALQQYWLHCPDRPFWVLKIGAFTAPPVDPLAELERGLTAPPQEPQPALGPKIILAPATYGIGLIHP